MRRLERIRNLGHDFQTGRQGHLLDPALLFAPSREIFPLDVSHHNIKRRLIKTDMLNCDDVSVFADSFPQQTEQRHFPL
jgi:hypothetical protein